MDHDCVYCFNECDCINDPEDCSGCSSCQLDDDDLLDDDDDIDDDNDFWAVGPSYVSTFDDDGSDEGSDG